LLTRSEGAVRSGPPRANPAARAPALAGFARAARVLCDPLIPRDDSSAGGGASCRQSSGPQVREAADIALWCDSTPELPPEPRRITPRRGPPYVDEPDRPLLHAIEGELHPPLRSARRSGSLSLYAQKAGSAPPLAVLLGARPACSGCVAGGAAPRAHASWRCASPGARAGSCSRTHSPIARARSRSCLHHQRRSVEDGPSSRPAPAGAS
jgi:hypothetical protein